MVECPKQLLILAVGSLKIDLMTGDYRNPPGLVGSTDPWSWAVPWVPCAVHFRLTSRGLPVGKTYSDYQLKWMKQTFIHCQVLLTGPKINYLRCETTASHPSLVLSGWADPSTINTIN